MIKQIEMVAGDLAVLKKQAHGVEFLEETRILEAKQGPYQDGEKTKVLLQYSNG